MGKTIENPWFSIWRKPEQTVSQLLNKKSNQHIWLISALVSFSITEMVFVALGYFEWIDKYSWQTVLLAVGIGFLGCGLYWYAGGYILSTIGRWFNGTAKQYEVIIAIAWSSIPIIVAIPFWLPSAFLVLSMKNHLNINALLSVLILLIAVPCKYFVNFLYAISFALLIRTLAAVHHFSKRKSFFTIILGSMLIVVPIIIYSVYKILSEAESFSNVIRIFCV